MHDGGLLGSSARRRFVNPFMPGCPTARSPRAGQGEGSPIAFYERYGFRPTGEVHDGEIFLRLAIN